MRNQGSVRLPTLLKVSQLLSFRTGLKPGLALPQPEALSAVLQCPGSEAVSRLVDSGDGHRLLEQGLNLCLPCTY